MKVKFIIQLGSTQVSEIIEINEDKIKGDCNTPKRKIEEILHEWQYAQVTSFYQILEDDRFDDAPNNIPYVDYVTAKRLGWLE